MRCWPERLRVGARIAWLVAAALPLPVSANASQLLPGNARLGMSAEQLHESIPALTRVAHPLRMSGGLIGSWSAPAIDVAGVAFTPTFFFSDGELRRVEYVAAAADAPAAFAAVRDWGRAQWGAELASDSPEGAYASWSGDEMDIYLQLARTRQPAQVRLVIKRHVEKDASEL